MNLEKLMLLFIGASLVITSCTIKQVESPDFDKNKVAAQYFQEDARWYVNNIPFFECSDNRIEQVYYYRWKLYKAHIRNVGKDEFVITEFINHVPWDRDPFCTINAASMHHIYEGRWLRDDRYVNGYISNLFNGGNNRRYSESVSDAAYARFLVNKDTSFLTSQLDSMKSIFNAWHDHYDSSKNMYYIPAMPDATEYTIASIDATGGKEGFEGGDAFRPTINSYMYANALAISKIAALKRDNETSRIYRAKADDLKANIEKYLWNDTLEHFTDRFKVNNKYVHYWDFIRGRELAGMIPWYFDLPSDNEKYSRAWNHLKDSAYLLGNYGLRTNEPSYEYYFKQFVFFEGKPGSQWNGPSWPYQTSQALTGMANLLNDYHQNVITNSDYLKVLRLYTEQHILPDGRINLVENYDPDKGGPIVYYYWSNHYLHSSFNNLVITGLCGVRPSEDDSLTVHPLTDSTIDYFMLKDIKYHGHDVTIVFDRNGDKYKIGKGVLVFVDGKYAAIVNGKVYIGKPVIKTVDPQKQNIALNITKKGFPKPSASINNEPDTLMSQAIDGRIWYFPEIINYWSTRGSQATQDWFALEFEKPKNISEIGLYLFADNKSFFVPDSLLLEYKNGESWLPVVISKQTPAALTVNTSNNLQFSEVSTEAVRVNLFHRRNRQVAFSEIEVY
jgi:hypothetical protein